jgi:crotonobetainyl-CoA:carnitine CoA-transferase CaiB-like acyl-CoA transferase
VHHKKLGDTQIVNQAIELSRTPSRMRMATPDKGEHTQEVLREFGYDDAAIASLRERKVI